MFNKKFISKYHWPLMAGTVATLATIGALNLLSKRNFERRPYETGNIAVSHIGGDLGYTLIDVDNNGSIDAVGEDSSGKIVFVEPAMKKAWTAGQADDAELIDPSLREYINQVNMGARAIGMRVARQNALEKEANK